MFGLASGLGTQRRKVKTGERGVSGGPTAAQRGSRWGGRLPMRRGTGTPTVPSGSGLHRVGGCFLTRRHGGGGVSGDDTAAQRGSRCGGRLTTGARGGYRRAV